MEAMNGWTSVLRRRWAGLKRRLFAPAGVPPGQVQNLLDHARRSGPDNLLHLLHVIEELHGHRRSAAEKVSVDHEGRPLPWYTYPAIAYLEGLDLSAKRVFEYGAGYGSWYYAARAQEVVSVESDRAWHERISAAPFGKDKHACPTLWLRETEEDFVAAIARTGRTWDVVVIDGAWRRRCARAALDYLAPTGFLILDNADSYPHTAADLRGADLLQVDFAGLGPINYYTWTTSFFFRRNVQLAPRGAVQPAAGVGSLLQVVDDEQRFICSSADLPPRYGTRLPAHGTEAR
jgi:predicted O-methyltransferase YrrM